MPSRWALVVLLCVALPAFAGPGSAPGTAPGGKTSEKRHERIRDALAKLDQLVADAKKDPRLVRIRAYRAFTPDQLADVSRGIDAEELLGIVRDEAAPAEIREEAAAALTWDSALRNDPALDLQGRGMKRARALFTMKVLPLLTDKDLLSRSLGKAICEGLWPGVREEDVPQCDPRKKESCRTTRTAWERYIRK